MQLALPDEILTRRLRLRKHAPGDAEVLRDFVTNPESQRDMMFPDGPDISTSAEDLLPSPAGLTENTQPVSPITITLLGLDRPVGSCGLSPTNDDGVIEVYFTLVPAAQGHGYATEALEALVEIARGQDIQKMIARVVDGNRQSIGVLERVGFQMSQVVDRDFGSASIYTLNLR